MFTLTDNPTFRHPVTVQVPVDGGHREETLQATFRVLAPEEVEKHDLAERKSATAFLQKIIVSLDDLVDADKKPVPYSDEVRDQVLKLPYARLALTRTYFTAVAKAPEGN